MGVGRRFSRDGQKLFIQEIPNYCKNIYKKYALPYDDGSMLILAFKEVHDYFDEY